VDMNFQPQDLEQIQARTFIVHGENDPLIPLEIAEIIRDHIPDSSLWMISEGGHVPVFGEAFQKFFSRSSQFLTAKKSKVEKSSSRNS